MMVIKMDRKSQGDGPGPGERAERKKHRFKMLMMAVAVMTAVMLVTTSQSTETGTGSFFSNSAISATAAVFLTVLWVVSAGGGTWLMTRRFDEHERAVNDWSLALGANVFGIGYPVWLLLWKGRIVPEPNHVLLFLIFWAISGLAMIYKKSR